MGRDCVCLRLRPSDVKCRSQGTSLVAEQQEYEEGDLAWRYWRYPSPHTLRSSFKYCFPNRLNAFTSVHLTQNPPRLLEPIQVPSCRKSTVIAPFRVLLTACEI